MLLALDRSLSLTFLCRRVSDIGEATTLVGSFAITFLCWQRIIDRTQDTYCVVGCDSRTSIDSIASRNPRLWPLTLMAEVTVFFLLSTRLFQGLLEAPQTDSSQIANSLTVLNNTHPQQTNVMTI